MNLFAESSAVLAWLLEEPTAGTVLRLLGEGELVVASDLTLVECDRVNAERLGFRVVPE